MNNRVEIAREFAKSIKSENIVQIILFGSVARGDDNEESDIDILIVSPIADEIRHDIHQKAIDIIFETDEVISARIMSVDDFNKTKNYSFLSNVLNDGVVIL